MTPSILRTGSYGYLRRREPCVVARFFFALLSLARFGISIGFIDRPIFAGFLWGLISGDMTLALSLAVFYELFWLDLFHAGTYIPPNPLFPMLCILALAPLLHAGDAAAFYLPVILTLPLGFFGAFWEKKHREWQTGGYNRLLSGYGTSNDLGKAAAISIGVSLTELFLINLVVFTVTAGLLYFLMDAIVQWQGNPLRFSHATWPLLWIVGGVGGVMALRTRRSLIVFAAGSAGVFLLALHNLMW